MKVLVLDAGHGYNTPGKRTPDDIREWSMNNGVCNHIQDILKDYDVDVRRVDDTTGKTDVSLVTRTNNIKKIMPNLVISIHHNALGSTWNTGNGVEAYAHPKAPAIDKSLSKKIVDKLAQNTGLKNRGAKTADFHMVREIPSSIPAVLVEGGFMDNKGDHAVITTSKGQYQYAKAVADVVIEYLGLTKKVSTSQPSQSNTTEFKIGDYGHKVKIVNAGTLNVRSGRGTEHSVIGTLKDGDIVTIQYILPDNRDGKGDDALWGSITFNGKTGFIHLGFCQPV